jgi:hypothetical protein
MPPLVKLTGKQNNSSFGALTNVSLNNIYCVENVQMKEDETDGIYSTYMRSDKCVRFLTD